MQPSRFHNIPDSDLADQLGRLDAHAKLLAEQTDEIKDEIKRRGVTAIRGADFAVTVSTSTSRRLDTDKVRELLGAELGSYQTESTVTRVLVKALPRLESVA